MRDPATRSQRHVVAYLATMAALMAFGVDVSLPALDDLRDHFDLAADDNAVSQVVSVYLLGMSVGQIIYGPLADRFGRAPVLRAGLGLYALGALLCTVAPSLGALLAARALWGFGAASASVLRTTIARDLYSGDQMARVISVVMGFFLLGPIVAPLFGSAVLAVASWRWVFGSAVVLCGGLVAWSFRFGETLDPADRRPLRIGPTLTAVRRVFTTRVSVAYLLAQALVFGAFFTYLASTQPIFDVVYDRAAWFPPVFAAGGALMAVAFFAVNPFIARHGAHRVAVTVLVVGVALGVALLAITLAADGRPGFWTYVVGIAVMNGFLTLLTPTAMSLALEPLGDIAGTASGVVGLVSMAGASLLSAVLNAQVVDTVTPLVAGYVVLGVAGLACALASGAGQAPSTRSR